MKIQLVIDQANNLYGEDDIPIPKEKHRELALDIRDNKGLNHMHVMTFGQQLGQFQFVTGRILIFTKRS